MSKIHLVLALVLVVSTVAVPVAADEMTAIDADHGLTDQDQVEQFRTEGVATASKTVPNLRLTVATNHGDVGLSGFHVDFDKVYLRLQYNETVPRTIRFYIPSEYWYPITDEGKEAVSGDVTASFEPTASGRYTAVTVTLTGQTDAVWAIPKEASLVFWGRSKSRDVVNNTTGYQPPRVGADGEWRYIPDGELDNASSYPVNTSKDGDATIQYDADPTAGEESWRTVPECSGDDVPVCQYEKAGVDGQVFVLSKTADPPEVRFKTGTDASATASSSARELWGIPSKVLEDIGSLFGGDEEESDD